MVTVLKGQKSKILNASMATVECMKLMQKLEEIKSQNESKINELDQIYSKSVRILIFYRTLFAKFL